MIIKIFRRSCTRHIMPVAAIAAALSACGGGGSSAGPAPVPPVSPPMSPPPVQNVYTVDLASRAVVAGSDELDTGTATVTHNVTAGEIEATATLDGVTAESITIRGGFAGQTGDELFALSPGGSPDDWQLAATPVTDDIVQRIEAGSLYVIVGTATHPDGALRGQILADGITVDQIELSAEQVTGDSRSPGTATVWMTFDDADGVVTVHLVSRDVPDIDNVTLRDAAAGDDGPVLEIMAQDSANLEHWVLDTSMTSPKLDAARSSGTLYVEATTPAEPSGAIRGQLVPDGMELVVTELTGAAVVMPKISRKPANTMGRVMTTIKGDTLTSHVNLYQVPNADGVRLRRAPAGQNGPMVASFEQDINDPTQWSLLDHPIDTALMAALDNRSLYVDVSTPGEPEGAVRGQIETLASMNPPDDSAFVAVSSEPANASVVESMPSELLVGLNREPLSVSVSEASIQVAASGGDGNFSSGNEVAITPATFGVDGMTIAIGMNGAGVGDDVYRVSLDGDGTEALVDASGIPLDGDSDGQPGGTFEFAFEVRKPAVSATFTRVQNEIFSPNCTAAGCHSGSSPPDGLLLTQGSAWANIVNVNSVQMPSLLRIEPGDPDNSYLVRKVEGDGIVANRMPLGQDPLPQELIDLLRAWVENGAMND